MKSKTKGMHMLRIAIPSALAVAFAFLVLLAGISISTLMNNANTYANVYADAEAKHSDLADRIENSQAMQAEFQGKIEELVPIASVIISLETDYMWLSQDRQEYEAMVRQAEEAYAAGEMPGAEVDAMFVAVHDRNTELNALENDLDRRGKELDQALGRLYFTQDYYATGQAGEDIQAAIGKLNALIEQ